MTVVLEIINSLILEWKMSVMVRGDDLWKRTNYIIVWVAFAMARFKGNMI